MKILYITPLIPEISGSGGKRAIYNHLADLSKENVSIDLIAVDVDEEGNSTPEIFDKLNPIILQRGIRRGSNLKGLIQGLIQLLFDKRPRSAGVVTSPSSRKALLNLISTENYDLVVIDHLNGWSLCEKIDLTIPLTYISHNIETDILSDQIKQHSIISPRRWRLFIEKLKMQSYEFKLLNRANRIICIASGDAAAPMLQMHRKKLVLWPELPIAKVTQWIHPESKKILFVGSFNYFPNREAINWLIEHLMPKLSIHSPETVLHIVGASHSQLNNKFIPSNVVLEGFVSNQKLNDLHNEAELFVCPVVLGSGVKIKILEASAYGIPIVATPESLAGIDYLHESAIKINRDAQATAELISVLLRDPNRLKSMSITMIKSLQKAHADRRPLLCSLRA